NAIALSTDLIVDTAGEQVLLSGELSGSGKLIKQGAGTLELAGSNRYLGGTEVNEGVLALDADAAASTADVIMAADTTIKANTNLTLANVVDLLGPVTFDTQGFNMTLNGAVINNTGGQLIKTGTGRLTLNQTNTYTAGTVIEQGTLALYGSLISGVDVQSGTTFGGTGTVTGDVTNAGTISPSLDGARSTLTFVGNYVGQSGTFASTLGGTAQAIEADQISIQGTGNVASGSTTVTISDPTGVLGEPTTGDGILLVDVSAGATSTSTAFTAPRIAAGAYEYTLVRGGQSSAESWFLRADIDEPPPPVIITPEVAQREEVALYPSLPSLARQYLWSINGTLDDRRGVPEAIGQWDKQPIAWGRIIAQGNESEPGNVNDGPGLKAQDWGLQLGVDLWRSDSAWGQWRVGPVATIGRSTGNAYNTTGTVQTGNVSLNAYSLGLNATVASHAGAYADILLLGTRLTGVQANSPLGTSINTTGWAFSGSLEGGWRVPMTSQLAITPQAQVYVTTVDLNSAKDAYSLIQMPTQTTTVGRLGLKLSYDNQTEHGQAQFWARASVFSTLSGKDAPTSFLNLAGTNPTTFQSQAPSTWMAIDAAVDVKASDNTHIQLGLGYQTSLNSQYRGVYGQVNVRFGF
ncbi:MAG: autotransporter outer membrane beta-barrel domain-containing protein, partial [Burkholderiaceae bacterium]|nr:autotransporter outer membrane beta-barrel domain-containing protein [Burkholderiaceae bacterium]